MRDKLKQRILLRLQDGQLTHTELCESCDASLSTTNLTLRELLESKLVNKMRVGRNVYYALATDTDAPRIKQINYTIMSTLSQYPSLTLVELSKRCPDISSSDLSKALAKLAFTSKIFKHAREKSRHIHYSTSNFVDGLLLVNSKRRKLNEQSDNVVGPFLKQFLFNLPITDDV